MAKSILVLALGVLALVNTAAAECDTCTPTNFAACINSTSFYFCYNGNTKSTVIGSCTPGNVCTAEIGVCKPAADFEPDCGDKCRKCLTAFACISKTEYVFCNADGEPQESPMTCPKNKLCNIDKYNKGTGDICVSSCENEPTCLNEVPDRPDPVEEYAKSCIGRNDPGYYPNNSDPTCKSYVFCQSLKGEMTSIYFTCPTGTYFDKNKMSCVTTRPSYCTAS